MFSIIRTRPNFFDSAKTETLVLVRNHGGCFTNVRSALQCQKIHTFKTRAGAERTAAKWDRYVPSPTSVVETGSLLTHQTQDETR